MLIVFFFTKLSFFYMLPSKTFKGCESFDMLTTLFLSFLPRFMLCCSSLLLHDAAVLLLQLYICYCLSLCMPLSLSISLAGFHCLYCLLLFLLFY